LRYAHCTFGLCAHAPQLPRFHFGLPQLPAPPPALLHLFVPQLHVTHGLRTRTVGYSSGYCTRGLRVCVAHARARTHRLHTPGSNAPGLPHTRARCGCTVAVYFGFAPHVTHWLGCTRTAHWLLRVLRFTVTLRHAGCSGLRAAHTPLGLRFVVTLPVRLHVRGCFARLRFRGYRFRARFCVWVARWFAALHVWLLRTAVPSVTRVFHLLQVLHTGSRHRHVHGFTYHCGCCRFCTRLPRLRCYLRLRAVGLRFTSLHVLRWFSSVAVCTFAHVARAARTARFRGTFTRGCAFTRTFARFTAVLRARYYVALHYLHAVTHGSPHCVCRLGYAVCRVIRSYTLRAGLHTARARHAPTVAHRVCAPHGCTPPHCGLHARTPGFRTRIRSYPFIRHYRFALLLWFTVYHTVYAHVSAPRFTVCRACMRARAWFYPLIISGSVAVPVAHARCHAVAPRGLLPFGLRATWLRTTFLYTHTFAVTAPFAVVGFCRVHTAHGSLRFMPFSCARAHLGSVAHAGCRAHACLHMPPRFRAFARYRAHTRGLPGPHAACGLTRTHAFYPSSVSS